MGKCNMKETIEKITQIIVDYNSTSNHNPVGLLDMARNLSTQLFFLEKHRGEFHKKFEGEIHRLVNRPDNSLAVNKAVNEANVKFPELYLLRRTMESSYKVLEVMRSELSYLKAEMNNTNIRG